MRVGKWEVQTTECKIDSRMCCERSQDGVGIGRGDQFFAYKFIERTTER